MSGPQPTSKAVESLQSYEAPPRPTNLQGETRRAGIELELGHLSLEITLEIVQRSVGGRVTVDSAAQGGVIETAFGKFGVEVDSRALKERAYLRPLESVGVDPESAVAQLIESSVVRVAREIIPIEVVTPPIPWDRLHELDSLWVQLRAAGAEDTRSSIRYAFGMHLNPEAPDFEVKTILSYLQAFLLLEPWLSEVMQIDLSRRIAPYIRPFPAAYRQLIVRPDYVPDWQTFVDDYVEHNPTRNRPLDLMPLFVHATDFDLSAKVEDWALVKSRPTFHYRLPNSEIQQPGWTPAIDWNRWVIVERLACEPNLLAEMLQAYSAHSADGENPSNEPWLAHLQMRMGLPPVAESPLGP
jgi:hypothetical protein